MSLFKKYFLNCGRTLIKELRIFFKHVFVFEKKNIQKLLKKYIVKKAFKFKIR